MSGLKYYNSAESVMNSWFVFDVKDKYDNASELYKNSGNAYKMENDWVLAAKSFTKAAETSIKADNLNFAVTYHVEAANCYKRINPVDSINSMIKAIKICVHLGKFDSCGKYWKTIGEIYEADKNYPDALIAYEKSADFFEKCNSVSGRRDSLTKVADFTAVVNPTNAANIYEKLAKDCFNNNLSRFKAKEYFYQALQCILVTSDYVNLARKLEEYKNLDFSFSGSRECRFIEKLAETCENSDPESFSQACFDYDNIIPLNPLQVTLLQQAKEKIIDPEPDLS